MSQAQSTEASSPAGPAPSGSEPAGSEPPQHGLEPPETSGPLAWQPFTPRGVAAFAGASWGRLLLVQFLLALLAASSVVWFLHRNWYPIISEAVSALPAQGEIRAGHLDWPEGSARCLAQNRFLALMVDLNHEGTVRSPAHVQVEFGRTGFKLYSLLGFVPTSYPSGYVVEFNRQELLPWWGAWAPALVAMAAGAVIVGLLLSWSLLASLYCGPVWLVAFFANRQVSLAGSWRLAGAALMPGALFMIVVLVFYGLGALDQVQLLFLSGLHLVVGWLYVLVSPLSLARHPEIEELKQNPFVTAAAPPVGSPAAEPAAVVVTPDSKGPTAPLNSP